jgi:hypothetical protein
MSKSTVNRVYEKPATLDEAYRACEHLILSSVAGFVKKHNIDYDVAMERAYFGLMESWQRYDSSKGSFGATVCYLVWVHMMEEVKERTKRSERLPTCHMDMKHLTKRTRHSLEDFKERLTTEDAKSVVQLLFDLDSTAAPGKNRHKLLNEALVEAGWAATRIIETFREIGAAIMEQCPRRSKKEVGTESAT